MLSREISLQRSPKFSIGSRHFQQVLNGQAAKRDVIPSKRFLSCQASLQPYRFEPERVPNAEDRESENEEVNDRAHFGVLVKPYQRKENVFVPEKSQSQKTKNYGRNNFNLILHCRVAV